MYNKSSKIFVKSAKWVIYSFFMPALVMLLFPGKIAIVTIACCYPLIFLMIYNYKVLFNTDIRHNIYLNLFLFSNLIILIRGIFNIESKYDLGLFLVGTVPLTLLYPYIIYWVQRPVILQIFLKKFYYIILPFSLIFLFFHNLAAGFSFIDVVSPIYIFIILSPYLSKKHKLIIITISIISFFFDLTSRANMINIIVAYLISFTFLFKKIGISTKITNRLFNYIRIILLVSPIVLIILGITGIFNIFAMNDSLSSSASIKNSSNNEQELLVDSRTTIYSDVFIELKNQNSYFFGLGGNGKTHSSLTSISYANFDKIYQGGRPQTESGMLNFIQWGGIFSSCLYFLLITYAAYLAIKKSNNWFIKAIGLWIAYKGIFSFISDSQEYDNNTLFLMITIGIALNTTLRNLSEKEMKLFLQTIFRKNNGTKRYISALY
ncbi:MAG: hypothetical protein PW786_00390 [Arachidicoccus sp.]|nr:hypothetical protein [Arachidicoccus sp.]